MFGQSLPSDASLSHHRTGSGYCSRIRNEGRSAQHPRPRKPRATYAPSRARPEDLTQRVAGLVLPGTYVQPGQQDGVVVASPVLPRQPRLPLAEAAEGVVRVMSQYEPRLGRVPTRTERGHVRRQLMSERPGRTRVGSRPRVTDGNTEKACCVKPAQVRCRHAPVARSVQTGATY